MSEENEHRRVSTEQLQIIVDFMAQHSDLAMGLLRSVEFRQKSKKLWADLTKAMHSRPGARKTAVGWSKYWSDYKNKLKNKLRVMKVARNFNEPPTVGLTKMDKRVLGILGNNYYSKRRAMQRSKLGLNNSFKDSKIKTEPCDENDKDLSSDSDGLSDDDDIGKTLPMLNVNCEGPISSDLMDNICPQWLIDSEQKRAEAEMVRARAEERRASIAAKNAEAAILQAEALKKLADAATAQADALKRIADVLELRRERDGQEFTFR